MFQAARSVWGLDIGKSKWACVKLELNSDDQITGIHGEAFSFDPAPTLTEDCIVAIADVRIGLIPDSEANDTAGGGGSGARPVDRGARHWVLNNGSVAPPPMQEKYRRPLKLRPPRPGPMCPRCRPACAMSNRNTRRNHRPQASKVRSRFGSGSMPRGSWLTQAFCSRAVSHGSMRRP